PPPPPSSDASTSRPSPTLSVSHSSRTPAARIPPYATVGVRDAATAVVIEQPCPSPSPPPEQASGRPSSCKEGGGEAILPLAPVESSRRLPIPGLDLSYRMPEPRSDAATERIKLGFNSWAPGWAAGCGGVGVGVGRTGAGELACGGGARARWLAAAAVVYERVPHGGVGGGGCHTDAFYFNPKKYLSLTHTHAL
ncbi:unnamed protein product, partial [Urochloa humidicola]